MPHSATFPPVCKVQLITYNLHDPVHYKGGISFFFFGVWFINFRLIHGAIPNLIKYKHFVLPTVKLGTVRLSLTISLKNSARSAQELNDEYCFTTLSAYFISSTLVAFWALKIGHIKQGALVLEDADYSGVLWKTSVIFNPFTFFLAASWLRHAFSKHLPHHSQHLCQTFTYSNDHEVVMKFSWTNPCKPHHTATFPWVLSSPFPFFVKLQVLFQSRSMNDLLRHLERSWL